MTPSSIFLGSAKIVRFINVDSMRAHCVSTKAFTSAALLVACWACFATEASAIDCSKATGIVDKAICGSETLRQADAGLSDFYFATLRKLEGARHQLLLDSQRLWLAERDRDCREHVESCVAQSIAARQNAIAVCFADGAEAVGSETAASVPSCPYYLHRECPAIQAIGSPGLKAYPFLVEKLVSDAQKAASSFDCVPDPDAPYDPSDNEETINHSIVTERPGLVCVDEKEDGYYAGAAHPFASEKLECFDTALQAKIELRTVFPTLIAGSPDLDAMIALLDGHLVLDCCGIDATDQGTFTDLGLQNPAPSGWAVSDSGDLMLGFEYSAFGRAYQATAIVPRAAFIDLAAPKYRPFFVAARAAK